MPSDDFQGSDYIAIQPSDSFVPIGLKLNAASASTANDGSMPYGSSVVSSTISAHHENGTDATTTLITASTESGNTIYVYLSYSTALTAGWYHLTAKVTVTVSGRSTNMVREFDLNRIRVKDK